MHILITALHSPSTPTGICRYAANLAQCLANTSEISHVTLVVGAWQKNYFNTAFSLGSPKIQLESIAIKNTTLSRNAWYILGLPKLANRLSPDIVHLSFPIPFLRNFFQAPIISTIHDFYPYEYPENFGYPRVLFNRLFLDQCIQNSDALSCVSKTTLQSLKKYFPKECERKITEVIYNCVGFEHLLPRIPDFMADCPNSEFLLCVAQHRKNKNLDLLIQAFASLLQSSQLPTTTQLFIVGNSGPETNNLIHLINQLSLKEHVLMLSAIDDRELCWLYQNAQLFVIPSATEGFCIPLAEALSFSCKVVCSAIPIFEEVGGNACTYFDLQGNAISNLAQAICSAIRHPQPAQFIQEQRFSPTVVAQQYLKLYSAVNLST